MNTNNLKKYAPQARRDFMAAVSQRLNQFGIHVDNKGNLTVSTPVISGSVMQIEGMSFDAGLARAREKLVQRAESMGFEALVEQMAYTWFNRLSAIRFMELHGYLDHNLRVLSPSPSKDVGWAEQREAQQNQTVGLHSIQPNLQVSTTGKGRNENTLPEILDYAQDVATDLGLDRNHIVELKLAGNKDEELYRTLLLGQCHQLHQAMPFLFEALDDETELLLPDNLTRTDSILRGLVDSIPEEDWQQVEIIGWLYQFYISEKKDQVIGSVVKSEDIPAATQLFTPNWIVKYLVQNSVGRQWLMTYPDSDLKAQMEYFIEPAEQEPSVIEALAAITPNSIDPETIKVLDPACGSGHILVEAYDILKTIYEERGYRIRDIPKLILEKNLYGLDIDDRAAQLAGFALMMKAREDDRRIFTRDIKLNVLALQSTQYFRCLSGAEDSGAEDSGVEGNSFASAPLSERLKPQVAGYDVLADLWRKLALNQDAKRGSMESIFDDVQSNLADTVDDIEFKQLRAILALFEQAKTLGSLIQVPHEQAEYLRNLTSQLWELAEQGDSMQKQAAKALMPYMQQAWLLAEQYDAVVANPPYMGSKYLNSFLKDYLKKNFNGFEKDLFSAFMIRNLDFSNNSGQLGFMSPFVWMFISSYEELRNHFIDEATLTSLVQLEYSGFDGATVPICTFTVAKSHIKNFIGSYIKLSDFKGHENQASKTLEAIQNQNCGWFYNTKPDDFKKIPGSPISYWLSAKSISAYNANKTLTDYVIPAQGSTIGENDKFLRLWSEIDWGGREKWKVCLKGGPFRKWYGNRHYLVFWGDNGDELKSFEKATIRNQKHINKPGIDWSRITSSINSFRIFDGGEFTESGGGFVYTLDNTETIVAFLNSKISKIFLEATSPTINCQTGDVANLPFINPCHPVNSSKCYELAKEDWNNYETSWDFTENRLIGQKQNTLPAAFEQWQTQNRAAFAEMQRLEEENNRLFIEAYGLQDELSPEVPEDQITLTRADQEKDIQRLLSYAIGCMMGRYSLDEPSLIYAHAGNVDFDPSRYPSFPADEDGILPLTDQEWFKDDASNRFREFLLAVWGEDTLQQNLEFVADSLTLSSFKPKKGETSLDTVRRYLSNQFYKDHLQTYKKRPIYWLFSSGKQKAFECLVYLHRYNDSTLARMRTEYVTPLLGKYSAFADQLNQQLQDASSSEATRIKKDIQALEKKQTELRQFDDKLKHYADMRIKLDLDDGVKVNYGKFGDLLAEVKAVTGGAE